MSLLSQGSTGQEVKNLQVALNYHLPRAPTLVVDGAFGPRTAALVVQFQRLHGLGVDGLVGPETSAALYSFVTLSHHLLPVGYGLAARSAALLAFSIGGDDPPSPDPSPFPFPPLPPLQLPFPNSVPPLPSFLQPPRLQLDPSLFPFSQNVEFELEAGQETSFKRNLSTGQTDREVALATDLKATVWSAPIGKHLEVSGGGGFLIEKRVRPSPQTEVSVYIFAKAETKDILKLGPLEIAKIEAEAQVDPKAFAQGPPDMSATLTVGPEVETLGGKLTFGPGAYLEYKTNGTVHTLTPGVKISGTWHF